MNVDTCRVPLLRLGKRPSRLVVTAEVTEVPVRPAGQGLHKPLNVNNNPES